MRGVPAGPGEEMGRDVTPENMKAEYEFGRGALKELEDAPISHLQLVIVHHSLPGLAVKPSLATIPVIRQLPRLAFTFYLRQHYLARERCVSTRRKRLQIYENNK